MLETTIMGKTGRVQFDGNGIRSDFQLRLIQNLGKIGEMKTVGTWNSSAGLEMSVNYSQIVEETYHTIITDKDLLVLCERYDRMIYPIGQYIEGLFDLLKDEVGFRWARFDSYRSSDDEVNGIGAGWMEPLRKGEADIAIPTGYADLSMSESDKRKQDKKVDITAPVFQTGISVAIRRSLVGQMNQVEHLFDQDTFTYGVVENSLVDHHIRYSNSTKLREMRNRMEASCPRWLVRTVEEGIDKVKAGRFAFFGPAATIEYHILNNCEMQQLGEVMNGSGYGLRLPKGSPYTSLFSKAITKLEKSGKLRELKMRIFKSPKVSC